MTGISKKYLALSFFFHAILFAIIFINVPVADQPVIKKTNQNDIINALVLGDVEDSKIMPDRLAKTEKKKMDAESDLSKAPDTITKQKDKIQLISKKTNEAPDEIKKIPLTITKKIKKLEAKKINEETKPVTSKPKFLAKNLLDDIKKESKKEKKLKIELRASKFQKTLHEQAEKTLRKDLLAENIRIKGKQSRYVQGEVNKYKVLILQSISSHWLVPIGVNKKLSCKLLIRLAPGGMVLSVMITESSGDRSLDRSARTAVLKASPLPVPKNPKAFEAFRQFVLKVKPENVLISGSP